MLPILVSLLSLVVPPGALDEQQWAALARGEILTELTPVAGSATPRGTALAIVDAPPERVFAACTDYGHFADFMPYVSSARIDRAQGRATTVSFTLDLPLLGARRYQLLYDDSPRDLVSRWRYTGAGDIRAASGSFTVEKLGDGRRSLVRYAVLSDPGGSLPDWLKRRLARPGMKRVIEALRDRVAR